jgi:hypothetical protein
MQVLFQPLPLTAIVHQPVNDKVISYSHRVCVAVHQHFTHTTHAISSYHDLEGWCALNCRAVSSTSWVSPGQPCCCSARSNGHVDVIKGTTAPGPGPMLLLIQPRGMHRPGQHARGVQTHEDLHTTGGWCGCICSADTSIPHATRFMYLLSCIAHMQHLTCGHLHAGPRWLTACCFNKLPPPFPPARPSLLTSPGRGHATPPGATWTSTQVPPATCQDACGFLTASGCTRHPSHGWCPRPASSMSPARVCSALVQFGPFQWLPGHLTATGAERWSAAAVHLCYCHTS